MSEPLSSNERVAFERWLQDVHGLSDEWDEPRNCYKQFPAHLAWCAWREAQLCAPIKTRPDPRRWECKECGNSGRTCIDCGCTGHAAHAADKSHHWQPCLNCSAVETSKRLTYSQACELLAQYAIALQDRQCCGDEMQPAYMLALNACLAAMGVSAEKATETASDPARPKGYVLRICTAYESGFGRGTTGRDLAQPYAPECDEAAAYLEGYTQARHRCGLSEKTGEPP